MYLRFDRGTLIFDDVPSELDLGQTPGVRFDPRVQKWRARACDREPILLDLLRKKIDVVDETSRALAGPPAVDAPALRPYQQAAVDAWEGAHRRGVVVMPTGSGKTRVAVAAIARTGCRALILVPTVVLLEQWRDVLSAAGWSHVGIYGDRVHEMCAVTVATMDAAWRSMHVLGDAFELVVVDEVHRVTGDLRSEALEMSIAPFRLGLTATMPEPDGAARLARLVGGVVHVSTLEDLAGSFLAPFELVVVNVDLTRAERTLYEQHMARFHLWMEDQRFVEPDLTFVQLAKRARRSPEGRAAFDSLRRAQSVLTYPAQKRAALARLLHEHRDRKVLVFTGDNRTAYAISREHLIAPITHEVKKAERQAVLDRFRAGTLRALVSSQVLNEGVDVPDADVAIVVGGRNGEREHIQRVGRVLRPSPGKSALVIELVVPRSLEARAGRKRRGAVRGAARAPVDGNGGDAWR